MTTERKLRECPLCYKLVTHETLHLSTEHQPDPFVSFESMGDYYAPEEAAID